jgi:hypothetical protein
LRKTESVTISGRWALFALCSACGEEFSPGSDTPFSMIIEDAFERRWPICNACAMAFLKTDE